MSRIYQIDSELRELELRREALMAERGKLVVMPRVEDGEHFTSSEKIALFLSLFRCREDVYAKLWENAKHGRKGYAPACGNEWFRGVCEKPRVKCSECFHQAFPSLDEVSAHDHLTISFKTCLIQYAGRLDRSWPGKSEVRIYDYVEPENRLTAHMFRKRMVAYRTMGYKVQDELR